MIGAWAALAMMQAAAPPLDPAAAVRAAMARCPQGQGGEIVVCARDRTPAWRYPRDAEAERFDPGGATESVSTERHRLMQGGEAGIGSCGPVGAGGFTGCDLRAWRRAAHQHGK